MTRRQLLASTAVGVAGIAASLVTRRESEQEPGMDPANESGTLNSVTQPLADAGRGVVSRLPQPLVSSSVSAREAQSFHSHIGWAYTCDESIPPEQMRADMQRMRDLGCTSIYIGHDNPARAGWGSAEPGLSFAVWYEIEAGGPEASAAQQKLAVIVQGIDIAREVGLQVVLPIDYQIQQGRLWSQHHPDDLALGPEGRPLNSHGDAIASPYSETFRRDRRAYYEWVQSRLLSVYPHIVALNLGDEPGGSDYSPHAMAAFERRFGLPWEAASSWQRGEFQAGVVADFTLWCAWQWELLNPTVRTLCTFHIERTRPFFPSYERIFQQAPPTFIISADTHLHDAPSWVPLTWQDTNLLHNLCRQLGLWSLSTGKDVMPWHSVNRWGLNDGGISEALDNHGIVVNETLDAGGRIAKTLAWGWNIRWQGLFRDEGNLDHIDKEAMLEAVSTAMTEAQPTLSERREPEEHTILYFPSKELYRLFDETQEPFSFDQSPWFNIFSTDFTSDRYVTLTDGPALEEANRRGWPIIQVGSGAYEGPTDSINYLPPDIREIHQGTLWFGATTWAAIQAVQVAIEEYEAAGLNWANEAGLYKGSIFANGQQGRYYEYVVFERAIFHQVGNRFETTLVFRDLANGQLELGEGNQRFLAFPEAVTERLQATPITGDAGSLAPSFTTLRPYLTLTGENLDEDRTGDIVDTSIAPDGTLGVYSDSPVDEIRYVLYDNGHNVPNVLYNEIIRRYGRQISDWWPRIGRPIGRALWMQSMLGEEGLRWVLAQPFERGILLYHPHYVDRPQFVIQGALIGNLLLRLVTDSNEPYLPEYHNWFV
ncbi:MAG TPA: hypothetical protein VEX37_07710 [Thermomicrobiales bacterium]|nr:hypothetical protein [Thermomicrobiales bacterium]